MHLKHTRNIENNSEMLTLILINHWLAACLCFWLWCYHANQIYTGYFWSVFSFQHICLALDCRALCVDATQVAYSLFCVRTDVKFGLLMPLKSDQDLTADQLSWLKISPWLTCQTQPSHTQTGFISIDLCSWAQRPWRKIDKSLNHWKPSRHSAALLLSRVR